MPLVRMSKSTGLFARLLLRHTRKTQVSAEMAAEETELLRKMFPSLPEPRRSALLILEAKMTR